MERRARGRARRRRRRAALHPVGDPLQAGRSLRRQVPAHRLQPVQLRQLGRRRRARAHAVQPAVAQRSHRHGTTLGLRPAARRRHQDPAAVRLRARAAAGTWARPTRCATTCHEVDQSGADTVLILGGDHVYKMDYRPMIAAHHANERRRDDRRAPGAARTRRRGWGSASLDAAGRVVDWEEKPAEPRSDLASMGVYVFSRDALHAWLSAERSDFGHDVIPAMLAGGARVFGQPVRGLLAGRRHRRGVLEGQPRPGRAGPAARPLRPDLADPHALGAACAQLNTRPVARPGGAISSARHGEILPPAARTPRVPCGFLAFHRRNAQRSPRGMRGVACNARPPRISARPYRPRRERSRTPVSAASGGRRGSPSPRCGRALP